MKKMIFGLTMATTLLLFAGCDKESQHNGSSKKPGTSGTVKTIPNFGVVVSYSCGYRICGAHEVGAISRSNMLILENQSQLALPSLTYTLYERTYTGGGVEVFAPFAQFTCSLQFTNYAGSLVNDNVKVLVIANDPTYPAPSPTSSVALVGGVLSPALGNSNYTTVTTGSYEDDSCGGNPNG